MILAIDKHAALYVFSSASDAERGLEAIDVQQDAFEFSDNRGQRYSPDYITPPRVSRLGPISVVDIGAFKLMATGDFDPTLPVKFIEHATHIEHSSFPAFTTIETLKAELRKQA